MNDLLKILSKSLQPFGYQVRKHQAPNILRIPALEKSDPSLQSLHKGFYPEDSNLDALVVYLRTCIRTNRNIDATPRLTGVSLEENTLRCVGSLIVAMNNAHKEFPQKSIKLVALDDRSDPAAQDKLKSVLSKATFDWEMKQTNEAGQGKSLHQQFAEGRTQNALTYFVEDDYLHEPDAIIAAWNFYKSVADKLQTHSVLYPQEHETLYKDHYPSYLILGEDRHWRTMRHATHTFLTHGKVVDKFWDYFENTKYVGIKKKRKLGSEARTTNKLFKHIPGFSPLKPIASHLQFEHVMPPLYDWKPLWEANKI